MKPILENGEVIAVFNKTELLNLNKTAELLSLAAAIDAVRAGSIDKLFQLFLQQIVDGKLKLDKSNDDEGKREAKNG